MFKVPLSVLKECKSLLEKTMSPFDIKGNKKKRKLIKLLEDNYINPKL